MDQIQDRSSSQLICGLKQGNWANAVVRFAQRLNVAGEPNAGHGGRNTSTDPVIGPKRQGEWAQGMLQEKLEMGIACATEAWLRSGSELV